MALSSTVTAWRRLRSMRTPTVSRLSMSNSSQAPRLGMTLTEVRSRSDVLSGSFVKYTPGDRTSWLTTTRSVPLMMKVPFGVMIGKSPMNTVWLLISPVEWLVNSAVTNSGAQYVRSFSLHSSIDALTSSKRGAEKERDMVPEKSSMGLISSRISARPLAAVGSPAVRAAHASLPTSQSKDVFWIARRLGTSRCSVILPKEIRPGAYVLDERLVFAGREAAKMRPSEGLCCATAGSRAARSDPVETARKRTQ